MSSVLTIGSVPKVSRRKVSLKKRMMVGLASALTIFSMATVDASAQVVANMYECDPDTGWCYQTNPPYNPNFARACRWNENVHNTWGMWYTGCTPGWWRPYVYA